MVPVPHEHPCLSLQLDISSDLQQKSSKDKLSPVYQGQEFKKEKSLDHDDHMEGVSAVTIDPSFDVQADVSLLLKEFTRDRKKLEKLLAAEKRRR
jgi:hypothetical protein